MRSWIYLGVLVMGFGASPPSPCQALPGMTFEDTTAGGSESLRLIVGGPEQSCLSWSWRDPKPGIELYPDPASGTFLGSDTVWTLDASGETRTAEPCHPAAFPNLGLGPASELWLLAPADEPAQSTAWTDLLDAIEAIYRQSTAAPLAVTTIGSLEGCAVRSMPVPLATRLDRWSPFELPHHAGSDPASEPGDGPMIRARRFQWWIEPASPGEACAAGGDTGTLRLFPVPTDTASGAEDPDNTHASDGPKYLLTVVGVAWQRLSYFAFDPDPWSPHFRALGQVVRPNSRATEAPEIKTRTSPEQRQQLASGELDLCQVEGIAALCAGNALSRRQLYTAIPRQGGEIPWPEERVLETQKACRTALGPFLTPDDATAGEAVCTRGELWQRPLVGDLVQGFSGDLLIARQPAIHETWHDGTVTWRLDPGGEHRRDLAATPMLDITLLNGDRVRITTRDLLGGDRRIAAWPWWTLLATALALGMLTALVLLARRRAAPTATGRASEEQLRQLVRTLVAEEVEDRLGNDARAIEQTPPTEQQLTDVARDLSEEFRQSFIALGEELRGSLRREAQSLSEGLHQDVEIPATPFERLSRELDELPAHEREPVTASLEAAGRLGDWIERLWPALQAASGTDVESIPRQLPESAADEWRRAARALHAFSHSDAIALRRLAHGSNGTGPSLDPAEAAFFERVFLGKADLQTAERTVTERLKRYLEPFDHLGRLGEVTLALQYLVEAYPIEQLAQDRRSLWRRELAKAQHVEGQDEDFHQLVVQIAAGVGLRYCPVRYYKSRTDQAECAFVRQQISPISLSERVGFEATADKEVIVRLERPFFFQLSTNIYFAGHAHVARG